MIFIVVKVVGVALELSAERFFPHWISTGLKTLHFAIQHIGNKFKRSFQFRITTCVHIIQYVLIQIISKYKTGFRRLFIDFCKPASKDSSGASHPPIEQANPFACRSSFTLHTS